MSERVMPRRDRTARPTAGAILLASLLLQSLSSGCAEAPAPSESDASAPPSSGAASPSPVGEFLGNALTAPWAPTLDIDAEDGALRFRWSTPPLGTHSLRLHVRDAHDGVERAIELKPASDAGERRLALSPHRTPWRDLSYRLEACAPDDCLSSPRVRVRALADDTFRRLRPAVAADGERYADAMAIGADGALLALALPTAGRVALWFTRGDEPRRGGTIDVHAPGTAGGGFSRTRRFSLAASANGDTIAVLTTDEAHDRGAAVAVFERLGEAWVESARFAAFETPGGEAGARTTVRLSRGGHRLLVARLPHVETDDTADGMRTDGGELIVHELDEGGSWRASGSLHAPNGPRGRLVAVSASVDLQRVFVATVRDGAAPRLWRHARKRDWQSEELTTLTRVDAGAPLALAASALGTQLAVGGFEPRRTGRAAPVLWRYRVDETAGALGVVVEDSIVLGPATSGVRASMLVADAGLDAAALSWSASEGASMLASVVRDTRGQWRTALILPDADADADAGNDSDSDGDGDGAGRPDGRLGDALAMDASGERLVIGVAPGNEPSGVFDAGSALLLR